MLWSSHSRQSEDMESTVAPIVTNALANTGQGV
jgi:hypothetical protein